MRPKSALKSKLQLQSKIKDRQRQRYHDPTCKTDPVMSRLLSTSRKKSQSPKSPNSHSLAKTKVLMVKSIRALGIVHAYRPSQLKSCMVKSNKTYSGFFSSDGKCSSNEIFFKSVITHFREWKKELQERMLEVFDAIMATDDLIETDFENQILSELTRLKQYGERLKSGIEKILESGTYKSQVVKLSENYEMLYKSLVHIINLIKNIFAFTKEITVFIEERQDIDLNDINAISEQMNTIRYKYEQRISQSLNFCACHPNNRLLMKIQFYTRQKLTLCIRNALNIFDSLKDMQSFEKIFRQKLTALLRSQNFDCAYLQGVIEFLYFKNQELRLSEKKFELNKRVQEKVTMLRSQIEAQQTQFIRKFRNKCLKDIVDSARMIGKMEFLHLVKNKGKQYVQLKKKWLLMVKVFQESQKQSGIDEKIYNADKKAVQQIIKILSESIKSISSSVQTVAQKMEVLQGLGNKYPQKNVKLVQKYKEEMKAIEEAQTNIDGVVGTLVEQFCKIEVKPQQIIEGSLHDNHSILDGLSKILIFSRNEESNTEIFKLLNGPDSLLHTNFKEKKDEKLAYILNDFEKKKQAHIQFAKNNLEKGITMSQNLREVNRQQLINYLFGQDFLSEFISNYQLIKNIINLNARVNQSIERIEIINVQFPILSIKVLEDYRHHINEQIKKLQKNKSKTIFNRYIVFLYEHNLMEVLNLKYIYKLCQQNEKIMNREDFNRIIGNFVYLYESVLSKNRKENSMFGELCQQVYEKAVIVLKQNRIICQYKQSVFSGQYYPSLSLLSQWLQLQFTADYGQLFSEHIIKAKRSQMSILFRSYIRKLQALKERKNTYKFINSDHSIWKDLAHTLRQLKQLTFQENYTQLVEKIMRYLRVKQIQHSALFTNDRSLICLFPFSRQPSKISKMVFNMLHIRFQYLNTNPNIAEEMPFDDSNDIPKQKQQKIEQKVLQNVLRINSMGEKKKQAGPAEQIVVARVLELDSLGKDQPEDMVEQIVEDGVEEIGEEVIQSQIPSQRIIQSVIQESMIPEETSQRIQKKAIPRVDKNLKSYTYWKISVLSNISILRKCLLYRNNEFKSIQKNINIETLCKINTSEGRAKLVAYIDQILEQANKSDFLKMLNLGCQNTEGEELLSKYQAAVKRNDSDLRNKLIQVMDYFRFIRTCVYEKGRNKIEAISKQGQEQCFVDVDLEENNYRHQLSKFDVDQLLDTLWQQIKIALSKGSHDFISNIEDVVSNFIRNTNNQIMAIYRQVEEEVSVAYKLKSVNKGRMEERIRIFLEKTINNKAFLSEKIKITNVFEAIQYIDQLSKQLKNINVVQSFFTLEHNNVTIFIKQWNIQQKDISRCLMLEDNEQKISAFIEEKLQGTVIKKGIIPESILKKISKLNKIIFSALYSSLFNQEKSQIWQQQKEQRQELCKYVEKYVPFLTLIKDSQLQQIQEEKQKIRTQLDLLAEIISLMHLFTKQKQKRQKYEANRTVKYLQKNSNIKFSRIIDQKNLNRFSQLLQKSKIPCYKLLYKDHIIALLQSNSIQAALQFLNIHSIDQKIKKSFVIGQKDLTIKTFTIVLQNIVSNQSKDKEISQIFKEFLQKTYIQVKTNKNVKTYNCLQLYNDSNQIQIELSWPQYQIQLTLYNSDVNIPIKLGSNQYHYFSKLEPIVFQDHFNKKLQGITVQIENKRTVQREKRQQEEAKRNELQKQNKKKDAQRELQLIKIENQRLRIELQNEKIHIQIDNLAQKRKMGESKLQQDKSKKVKTEESPEVKEDPFRAYQTVNLPQTVEDNLSLSVVLSQGHSIIARQGDIIFPHLKGGQKKKTLLDYDLTLSEHMQDNQELKEAKKIEEKQRQLDAQIKRKK